MRVGGLQSEAGCGGALLPALLAGLALGCAASPAPSPHAERLQDLLGSLRVASLSVEAGVEIGEAPRDDLVEYDISGVLRQSALDWLEQRRRFSPQGEIRVVVRIQDLRLRGPLAARWWPGLGAPDRHAVQVSARQGEVELARFERRVESRVGGRDWADSGARAQRLARRLGQRVAEAL